jgi:hypothetical protein
MGETYANAAIEGIGLYLASLRVCAIKVGELITGSGFLVGPDIILTNYHVIRDCIDVYEQEPEDHKSCPPLGVVFDFRITAENKVEGEICELHPDNWLVSYRKDTLNERNGNIDSISPEDTEADFALLRLARRAGDDQVSVIGSPGWILRGWYKLFDDTISVQEEHEICIIQFPFGQPMKESGGRVLNFNRLRTRLFHNVKTDDGSSGSPVFITGKWKIAAMHQAYHDNTSKRAIPLDLIARQLELDGHRQELSQDFDKLVFQNNWTQQERQLCIKLLELLKPDNLVLSIATLVQFYLFSLPQSHGLELSFYRNWTEKSLLNAIEDLLLYGCQPNQMNPSPFLRFVQFIMHSNKELIGDLKNIVDEFSLLYAPSDMTEKQWHNFIASQYYITNDVLHTLKAEQLQIYIIISSDIHNVSYQNNSEYIIKIKIRWGNSWLSINPFVIHSRNELQQELSKVWSESICHPDLLGNAASVMIVTEEDLFGWNVDQMEFQVKYSGRGMRVLAIGNCYPVCYSSLTRILDPEFKTMLKARWEMAQDENKGYPLFCEDVYDWTVIKEKMEKNGSFAILLIQNGQFRHEAYEIVLDKGVPALIWFRTEPGANLGRVTDLLSDIEIQVKCSYDLITYLPKLLTRAKAIGLPTSSWAVMFDYPDQILAVTGRM